MQKKILNTQNLNNSPTANADKISNRYQASLFLPKTYFPLRAGLPQLEEKLLQLWQTMPKGSLWQQIRTLKKSQVKYILHDGPPYANGHLHIGHALNKILKDLISRAAGMGGRDSIYIPGWDCHGLPIEWKVEEDFRTQNIDKNRMPVNDFRRKCRDYAAQWLTIQSQEFQRLGILGDWQQPYSTMDFLSEAIIADEIGKFVLNGTLYLAHRPVMWSIPEQTALAEAEVEYHDMTSRSIYVAFPTKIKNDDNNYEIVIWTTTPWTIPANRAIAFNKNLSYGRYQIKDFKGKERNILLAKTLATEVKEKCKWQELIFLGDIDLDACQGQITILHPFHKDFEKLENFQYYLSDKRDFYHADFVTDDTGTGFVHIAPAHGKDDYLSFAAYHKGDIAGRFATSLVDTNGSYDIKITNFITELQDKQIYNDKGKDGGANQAVLDALKRHGYLVGVVNYKHSYPHSWRSKAPIIFLATPQWFISMDKPLSDGHSIRQRALQAIDRTIQFFPANGKNNLREMIATRPDWCISRQRSWGVPLPLFVKIENGELLQHPDFFKRVKTIFTQKGADVWFDEEHYPNSFWLNDFVAPELQKNYKKIKDVVDVWFDSGTTHAFVLNTRPELRPTKSANNTNNNLDNNHVIADLYLEGTDQHRGWFHSSLLESVATMGRAPYRALLTHGFVLDEKGNKMSKSLGNVIALDEITKEYGAEIIRLWVVASNYTEHVLVGKNILKQQTDSYRRIRNTFRWLLGMLGTANATTKSTIDLYAIDTTQFPLLERYMLARLVSLKQLVAKTLENYEFEKLYRELYQFCDTDLSALYFDIRKDTLYCDAVNNKKRQTAFFTVQLIFDCLVKWFAPILPFTTEEVWQHRLGNFKQQEKSLEILPLQDSIHFYDFPKQLPNSHFSEQDEVFFQQLIAWRQLVFIELEKSRKAEGQIKKIGSGLDAHIEMQLLPAEWEIYESKSKEFNVKELLADFFIVSQVEVKPLNSQNHQRSMVKVTAANGDKCNRCWKILPEVTETPQQLCHRCQHAHAESASA